MQILKKDQYKKIPWKNGLGFTHEIAIFPEGSSVLNNDFQWRISSALIERDSDFSPFPGYNRDLLLLDGSIRLNDTSLSPLTPFSFSGDDRIRCKLIRGPAKDLNIFTKRGALTRNIEVLRFKPKEEFNLALKGDWNLAYLVTGTIQGDEVISTEDTIILPSKFQIGFEAISAGALVLLEILRS